MSVLNCLPSNRMFSTAAYALASMQWMADPDGDPATSWDVPHVCSNSWGLVDSHGYPPCDQAFWSFLDACEAATTGTCAPSFSFDVGVLQARDHSIADEILYPAGATVFKHLE